MVFSDISLLILSLHSFLRSLASLPYRSISVAFLVMQRAESIPLFDLFFKCFTYAFSSMNHAGPDVRNNYN